MNSVVYHQVEVENSKASYSEFDTLDFYLNAEGRALMKNSVRIEGRLNITKDNGAGVDVPVVGTDNIFIDNMVGAESIIDITTTEFQNAGLVENFNEYSRYYKMVKVGETCLEDAHSGLDICELITPSEQTTQNFICGNQPTGSDRTAGDQLSPSFSIKPKICLNRMSDDLSFSKSGFIKVSITLSKLGAVLYGEDVNNLNKYNISDVRLKFKSVPDVNNQVQMRTTLSLKSSINSQLSNTMAKVPAVCDGVSCVFIRQDRENTLKDCNTMLDRLHGIDELQFLFSDSTSQYISYVINDKGEMLDRFVESLVNTGHNQINANKNNMNFGVGLSFPPVDLSNQKFNIQIKSRFTNLNTSPFIINMYFHSFISL